MGTSVLVCVNPLRTIEDPKDTLGKRKASNVSHPYSVAEVAYQQLAFNYGRKEVLMQDEKKKCRCN